jgi:hypothetical protein
MQREEIHASTIIPAESKRSKLIPEVVLRRKIGLGFISLSSPQKENEGLALDYG